MSDQDDLAAEAHEGEETRIDAAWRAAQAAPESDEAAARFLDVVLAEALLCPIWDDGADEAGDGGEEAEAGAEVTPKMLEIEGKDTLLLFDSEDRLAAFSSEPTAFIALPGRAYFQMMGGQNAQIALNLDVAPSATLFGSETVDALAELAAGAAETVSLDPEAPLVVSKPTDAPSALVAAAAARLNAARHLVAEAWLVTLSEEDPGAPGTPGAARRLALLLRPGDSPEPREMEGLAMEIGQLGASFLDDSPLDVALVSQDDPILSAARAEGFALIQAAS